MKAIRKISALLLIAVLVLSSCLVSLAAAEPTLVKSYGAQSYVTVKGNAGAENAGYAASLMLVSNGSDPSKETIGYIGQVIIEEDGNYQFEFSFDDFTYTDGAVDNYELVLNVNGERMEDTITEATAVTDFVSFDLDFTVDKFGKADVYLSNEYDLRDLSYTLIFAFYDKDGSLVATRTEKKYTGDSGRVHYTYSDIPVGTAKVKAFLWEDTKNVVPLAQADTINVLEYTESRKVKYLTMAPGIDETERNFAWFDDVNAEGARVQYAPKINTENLEANFDSPDAKIAVGESGIIDVSDSVGKARADGAYRFTFFYDYTYAKVTITDLLPGTEYVYRVGDKIGWCDGIYEFKTDNPKEDGFKFLLFSDEHLGNGAGAYQCRDAALEHLPDPSFIYTVGDLVELPKEEYWEYYFNDDYFDNIPLAAVPGGTHDTLFADWDATVFGYHFNMPNQSETSGYVENIGGNYWFTYGDALFIGIVYNRAVEEKIIETNDFIEEAVAANPDAKWRILVTHYPFTTTALKGSTSSGDEEEEGEEDTSAVGDPMIIKEPKFYDMEGYGDIVADNNIDIVFQGHSHVYYSTYPIYKGEPDKSYTEIIRLDKNENGDPIYGEAVVTKPANGQNKSVYVLLNTVCNKASKRAMLDSFQTYADSTAIRGSAKAAAGEMDVYHTYYTTVSVKDNELTFETYRNTHCDDDDNPDYENNEIVEKGVLINKYTIKKAQ